LSSPEKREEGTQRISVGFIGAITELKGITRFLDDLITLKKEGWELKLVVCGSFDDNLPQVIKSDVVNKCVYLGRKFGEEKFTEFFNSIDLLYFPTMYPNEAQPLVVYEALSSGVKVVASNVGTIKQQLELPIFGSVIDDSSVQNNRLQAVRMGLANLQTNTKPLIIEAYENSQNKAMKDLSYILEVIKYELGT
jgi:glycosyltransferase involved in cell wall biosynthesis